MHNLEFALLYAQRGWRILPLHTPQFSGPEVLCSCGKSECGKKGKHPRIPGWQHDASCDSAIVRAWFEKWPDANIGLSLDGLLALDVDPKSGGPASLSALEKEHGPLAARARQRSGSGGFHYLFSPPEGVSKKVGFRPGLDLLTGSGCYIVVQPSRHSTGGTYAWIDAPDPLSDSRDKAALTTPPQWLLDTAFDKAATDQGTNGTPRDARPSEASERVPVSRLLADAVAKVHAGEGRNDSGLWLFCQIRDAGYSREEAIQVKRQWVDAANQATPGADRYTQAEADASLKQAFKRQPREPWKSGEGEFALKESGLFKGDVKICDPVEIVAYGSEGATQGFRLLKLFDHDGNIRELTLRADQLEGTKSEFVCVLLEAGLKIEVGQEGLLLQYLRNTATDARFRVTSSTGWQDGGNLYVLPDATFGEQPDLRIKFNGHSEHRFKVSGSLAEWQEHVSQLCIGNSRLMFAASCAFAGPLLPLMDSQGCGFHLRGTSSTGKSTALKVAGSVLGGGGKNAEQGFLRSWDSTINGLEGVAKLHNHGLLCLDEIGLADSKKIGTAVYMLVNGSGRERMKANLERREASTWSLVLLSSGEKSLADHVAEAGQRTRGGQELRLIDIPADAGAGYGLFEDTHGMTPKAFATVLGEASCHYYGTAFREWLRMLNERRAACATSARELVGAFEKERTPQEASPEMGRAARWFALMAAAGELATEAGITRWPAGEATRGTAVCFEAWVNGRAGGAGSSDEEQAVSAVRHFLEQHGGSRFETLENPDRIIVNRAGKRKGGEFWIFPETFRQDVCKGFNADAVAQALDRRGFLVRGEGKNLAKKPATRQERKELPRCYVVRDLILGDNAPAEVPAVPPIQWDLSMDEQRPF